MKIAIFHNFLDNIGGAEMVCLILARELGADIYTTNIDKEKIARMGFDDVNVYSIGAVPVGAPFRQQMALWRFRQLDLKNQYDFYIIAGDWAMSGGVNNKPNLWYVHSPIREIWDLYEYTRNTTVPYVLRPIFDVWVWLNRYLNRRYISAIQTIVCNSQTTSRRVNNYLARTTEVITPPVDVGRYRYEIAGNYWLSVNRLISHKRVLMQIEAFRKMPDKKLIIVGSYEQSSHFKKYAAQVMASCPTHVKIFNWVTQAELVELYAHCRGFVTTARDEDFGLTAVEAMAAGKPVVAPNEGGYKETVIDGITGHLINDIDASKLVQAISDVDGRVSDYKNACLAQAKKFDTTVFMQAIQKLIIPTR